MKRKYLFYLSAVCVFCFLSCSTKQTSEKLPESDVVQVLDDNDELEKSKTRGAGEAKKVFIQEINQEAARTIDAPAECIASLRGFIAYLFSNSPNIFYNYDAQHKWFAANMRKASAHHLANYQKAIRKQELPAFPDNATFINAEEPPALYSIIGSRWGKGNVVIDVLYQWIEGQNYEGDTRIASYDFYRQADGCKIHAISFKKSEKGISPAYDLTIEFWHGYYQ